MSAKESDIKHWTDPRDYGLPFVEITPIRHKSDPQKLTSEKDQIASAPLAVPTATAPVATSSSPVENAEKTPRQEKSTAPSITPLEDKKSSGWVWAVVLIALGIVAVIVWQIQANRSTADAEPASEFVETAVQQPLAVTPVATHDSTAADQNQNSVNQDTISPAAISDPNISKPTESGTTIANTATGNLIRVESKAERAQYFIIVGSLPNEKMALAEANQYFGRSAELYLISPIEGGRNYRLALSKFDSFRLAAAKLEEIKSQYTEELWILKY